MAITGIPIFVDGEIPPAAKLNQLGDAITNKFGGAVTPADMTWPFVVQGNIDFDNTYGIVALRTFWNIINAAEYDSLDDAITAAEAAGGTCVLIPPNTSTLIADGVDIDTSGITIMGCGKSSVIKLTPGSTSGYLLRTGAGSLSNISIENLTLDGQSAGTAQAGVIVRRVDAFTMRDVWLKNFTGPAVWLTNDGTNGNACTDAKIINCRFTGGSTYNLQVTDIDGLQIIGFKSTTAPSDAIFMEPGSSAGLMKRILMSSVDIETPTGRGIVILGAGASNANWSYIWLNHCIVTDAGGDGFNIGEASKFLKYVSIRNCDAPEATADAFVVNINIGEIKGCSGYSAGEDGLDLVSSDTVTVQGCDFKNATAVGIDLDGTTDAHIIGNNLTGSAAAYLATNATTPRIHGNEGAVNAPAPSGIGDGTSYSRTGSTGDMGFLYTIPANGVRVGDLVRIRIYVNYTHSAGIGIIEARLGGNTIGSSGAFPTANTEITLQWDCAVVGLSGAGSGNSILTIEDEQSNTVSLLRTNATVDFTTDSALTFQATSLGAGSTLQVRGISVDIIGAT